jgi:hypothetical protein
MATRVGGFPPPSLLRQAHPPRLVFGLSRWLSPALGLHLGVSVAEPRRSLEENMRVSHTTVWETPVFRRAQLRRCCVAAPLGYLAAAAQRPPISLELWGRARRGAAFPIPLSVACWCLVRGTHSCSHALPALFGFFASVLLNTLFWGGPPWASGAAQP